MICFKHLFAVIAGGLGGLLSVAVLAQSMTVITNGSDARACALDAELSASDLPTGRSSIERCTRALEYGNLGPSDTAATLVNRGILHAATGDYPAALKDYNRALEIKPRLAEPYIGRGNLVFMSQRYELAIEQYDTALSLGLRREHAGYYNRGLAFQKLGRLDEAEADFQRASELRPEWSLPQQKLRELRGEENPSAED